jgi:hypothetical protein
MTATASRSPRSLAEGESLLLCQWVSFGSVGNLQTDPPPGPSRSRPANYAFTYFPDVRPAIRPNTEPDMSPAPPR